MFSRIRTYVDLVSSFLLHNAVFLSAVCAARGMDFDLYAACTYQGVHLSICIIMSRSISTEKSRRADEQTATTKNA